MTRGQAYPPELARYVVDHWPEDRALSLSRELLCDALSIAFQASLTSEEMRPTAFRLLLMSPDHLPEDGAPDRGVLRLRFEHDRPLTVEELRRLAPSVPFETSLIGAHVEAGALRIWGIAHSGAAWLAPSWGGRSLVPNWTYDPIIHVRGPGQIAVRCAGKLVGAIDRGSLVDAMIDVFDSVWLPAMFEREREEVRGEHAERQVQAESPTQVEHSLIGRVGQHMVRRAIQLIRGARHGGMLLVVEGAPTAGLRPKYRFQPDEPTRRYRSLLFQILERVAAATSKPTIEWADFALDPSPDLQRLEQAVFELSRVIANLSAIDGRRGARQAIRAARLWCRGLGRADHAASRVACPRCRGDSPRSRRDRECRHPASRGLSVRERSPAGARDRRVARRWRDVRRESRWRDRLLGAVGRSVSSRSSRPSLGLPR
jgi:hypothetical protein